MPEPSWDLNPDRLRTSPQHISELEARIRAVPPDQRSHFQLAQMGIDIPPGYRLEPNGKLKYVAVDNSRPFYLNPKFAVPAVLAAGAGLGALGGAAGGGAAPGLAASVGAPAATEAAIFSSPAALASGAVAAGGGKGVWDWIKDRGRDAITGGDDDEDDGGFGGDEIKKLIASVIATMAARDAFDGNRQISPEERVQQDRINRNLAQQEQRTQFQNPLYEAVTRMAFGLLPNMGNNGQPYPTNSLADVKVPGFNE